MKRIPRLFFVALLAAGAVSSGCAQAPSSAAKEEAVRVEELDNGRSRVTLSARAAQRLGVETVEVREEGGRTVIPYAAVLYDAEGATWAYVASPAESLSFQRAPITVEEIRAEDAVLSSGPPAGTPVVIVGVAELYGAEIGVGGGH